MKDAGPSPIMTTTIQTADEVGKAISRFYVFVGSQWPMNQTPEEVARMSAEMMERTAALAELIHQIGVAAEHIVHGDMIREREKDNAEQSEAFAKAAAEVLARSSHRPASR